MTLHWINLKRITGRNLHCGKKLLKRVTGVDSTTLALVSLRRNILMVSSTKVLKKYMMQSHFFSITTSFKSVLQPRRWTGWPKHNQHQYANYEEPQREYL